MPKDNLRDKLEGNELDLSLNNLTAVPVKDLATLPKATHLDLSCNAIVTLPDNFCTLKHLVKIDLSKNDLTELPDQFGALQNLQHLDLLGNKIMMLPASFYQLRKLKWLDLKDNPLVDDLKKVAGDCLDEEECKKCAHRVVEYMKKINAEMERIRQRKLQEQREKEEAEKAIEEALIREKREQRKAEKKERRKREKETNKEKRLSNSESVKNKTSGTPERNGTVKPKTNVKKGKSKLNIWGIMLAIAVVLIAAVIGFHVFCLDNSEKTMCVQYWQPVINRTSEIYTKLRNETIILVDKIVNMTNDILAEKKVNTTTS